MVEMSTQIWRRDLTPFPPHPTLGVAMTTCNGSRFVATQVRSILNQQLPIDELTIGDDDSGDNTVEIVQSLVDDFNRQHPAHPIRLNWRLHRPRIGIRDNFSDAISATTTDVVFLSDQDDEWGPEKTTVLTAALRDAELVHSDAVLTGSDGRPLGNPQRPKTLLRELKASPSELQHLTEGDAFSVLLKRNLITGATVALRGEFARENMPTPPGLLHDEWLAMMAALDGRLRLVQTSVQHPLTYYRQHGGNAVGARKITLRDRWKQLTAGNESDNQRRLTRARSLAHAADTRQLGTPSQRHDLVKALAHQQSRSDLPHHRLARIPGIAAEAIRGNYSRYSRGWLTMIRDLLSA
ncbi:glycosyltransferase [Mobiluncus curtisii]|uniref:Glycosyltransferase n=2 Tax=Mobiluncus curtisii TaxID=2051 RepID=A0A7Y0UGX9_9ACTO|nr:glycosyltransferase [Mobiluncus curtisii]MCV0000045.1 glycosyltransferase [Mobiluncus curtisii]NMW48616.1 glycosyltransferase [Mobiluncus curtisii]NMW87053.1 glycosyltransferase [Mobiluncus curtisii]